MKDKDYFVLTTNVDHCFQRAGFDKHRLFYTQGDYGLFQCSEPCRQKTYDNEAAVREMLAAQGYAIRSDGALFLPEGKAPGMAIPTELVPHCPNCGKPMTMNLRCDDTFAEDAGWHAAAQRYERFLRTHAEQRLLFLELGVGRNTPGIIKYPFLRMVHAWKNAAYVCINSEEAYAPDEVKERSVCICGDIGEVLSRL